MCGICGFVSKSEQFSPKILEAMNASIQRRGPDGAGMFAERGAGIAMRRLAIIDLEGGKQPIYNEDQSVVVVLNGEIYNYRELRQRLASQGHRFTTHSDTEVLVHLYEEHGDGFAEHLRGMFAFALIDRTTGRVLLGRDRLGIKPLYIAELPEGWLFGSELKTLLATGLVPRSIDHQALDQYLTYTNVPTPRTIYSGVRKFPPATVAVIDAQGRYSEKQYWSIKPTPAIERSEAEWVTAVEQSFKDAVESHLVSDVPVGAFLSGGVDSGLVVAMMATLTDQPVHAFTVGFKDSGSSFIDERVYARALAKRYGVQHHEIEVAPNVEEIISDIVHALDEPFADDSVIPSYYVSQMAARQVKVAMTGLGGDELFGGYKRHLGLMMGDWYGKKCPSWLHRGVIAPLVGRLPDSKASSDRMDHLKRFLRGYGLDAAARYQDSMSSLGWQERSRLYTPEFARQLISPAATEAVILEPFGKALGRTSLDRALEADLQHYLMDDILTLTDRLSMWHSLELRVPFLDHPFVELAMQVPAELKISGSTQKYLLKRIARKWLPNEIIDHRKQGFEAPMGRWLRGPLLPFFDSVISKQATERIGIFHHQEIIRLRDQHVRGERKNSKILFSLLMFYLWHAKIGGTA